MVYKHSELKVAGQNTQVCKEGRGRAEEEKRKEDEEE